MRLKFAWAAGAVALAALLLTGYLWYARTPDVPAPPPEAVAAFLAQHWQKPLSPQGMPPAGFSALEASLAPEDCGQCHATQYRDWQRSLHSQTMTAGILWQMRLLPQAEANQCLDCHAPLAEQKALIAREQGWPGAPATPPPAHIPATLGTQGLVCAACHVRRHERFGPPPREESRASTSVHTVHGGFTASAAFQDSRFCAGCHQFPENGPRTAGKLREDTWAQWQASAHAADGKTCQSCHMPDRQHHWQGIHSREMVQRALETSLTVQGRRVRATLTNAGAGHHFPTYMVPKVTAQLVLVQGARETPLAESVIGWQVDVSLEKENFDTRLPAGKSLVLDAGLPEKTRQGRVELRVLVAPREHYERTFAFMLQQAGKLDAATLALLQTAYDEARATRFEALRLSRPLAD